MGDSDLDALLGDFLAEAAERAAHVEQLLLDLPRSPQERRADLLRRARLELHTLKGNAGMMGLETLQVAAHELEDRTDALDPAEPDVQPLLDRLDGLRSQLAALGREPLADVGGEIGTTGGVRISYDRLDELVELLAGLLLTRHQQAEAIAGGLAAATADGHDSAPWESCQRVWTSLDRSLEELQEEILKLRLVPVSTVFGRMRRIVHDEGRKTGKQARLQTRGGNTAVDRSLIDAVGDVLGHLVRNALVHGIEPPEQRRQAGKPEIGRVRIEAGVRSDAVQIDVVDDGAGIDREALRSAAEEAGVATAGEDLQALMFEHGLSTRAAADLSAGRGVGMSVVLEAVRAAGGTIEVASRAGIGTRFRMRLPVSVSIAKVLLVAADARDYALPVSAILDSLPLPAGPARSVIGWRGRDLPLLDLGVVFGTRAEPRSEGFVVAIEGGGQLCGLVADSTRGPLEIMVKGLDELLQGVSGLSGTSVLGDGRVVMILDPQDLAARASRVGELA